jgi:S1-C subfamily serine protease
MASVLQQLNSELSAVVEDARKSLVRVSNGRRGAGAGTIWHEDGMIITNAHVIGSGHPLTVTLQDDSEWPAQVMATDPALDLAALVIEADHLPTIELGDSKHLKAGAWVMALGHPWGVTGAVTSGTVIGAGATLPEMPRFRENIHREWLAVGLHMRPGHSGGALIDSVGHLLGVNTMISGPEVGFAVPVHVVKQFLKREIA